MALIAQEIPKVGLVMEEVKVVRWLKNVGDSVTLGEPLLEVETEKSVVEIEATVSGRLAQILVQVDQEAAVGDQIAWIESTQAPAGRAPAGSRRRMRPTSRRPRPPRASGGASGERVAARRLVAERGLDLRRIAGSGPPGGRVQARGRNGGKGRSAPATPQPRPASARCLRCGARWLVP